MGDKEFLDGLPPDVVEQYTRSKAKQDKLVPEAKESLGDLTIKQVGITFVGAELKAVTDPRLIKQGVQALKQAWQFRDGKGETFCLIEPRDLSPRDLTAIRDRIAEQGTSWNALPGEQRAQIERHFDPIGETSPSARPYQDYLRSKALERIFVQPTEKPN